MKQNFACIRRLFTAVATSTLAILLTSCGGGGGSGDGGHDLTVDFNYLKPWAYLWRANTIEFRGTGLEGHTPSCSVVSGTLPAGLILNSEGCSITGTATEAKEAVLTIRLTVPGYTGQIDKQINIVVFGPAIGYAFSSADRRGTPVSVKVSALALAYGSQPWSPQPGESVTYSIGSGALPDGLTLDPVSGEVSGIVSRTAGFNFAISVTARGPLGTAVQTTPTNFYNVVLEGLLFFYGPNDYPVSITVGSSVSLTPLVNYGFFLNPADYTFSNFRLAPSSAPLPEGLNLDPVTGLLSGTTQAAGQSKIYIQADVSAKSQRAVFTTEPLDLTLY